MLRDRSLIPLSRQHQHALALCVRIERASPIQIVDLAAWQAEITQIFQSEIRIHFAAEEQKLFPCARRFEQLVPLVEELTNDHVLLRENFAQAESQSLSTSALQAFARLLSGHIRKEERQLFEPLQRLMNQEQLTALGKQLDDALTDAARACVCPTEATRLGPRD